MNTSLSKLLFEQYNDYSYEAENSISTSMNILSNISALNNIEIDFYQNEWPIFLKLQKIYTYINFDELLKKCNEYELDYFMNIDKIISFKCWIASLLSIYEPLSVRKYFLNFREFIKITDGMKSLEFDVVYTRFISIPISLRKTLVVSILNLIDFDTEFFEDKTMDIIKLLDLLNIKTPSNIGTRKIPETYSFLVLDRVINDFFSTNEINELEYIYWTPIKFWWEMTTIIPMRISEFCLLEKTSFIKDEEKSYIQIKRIKGAHTLSEPTVDKILIPSNIYEQVQAYIAVIDKIDPKCNTLFSRKVLRDIMFGNNMGLLFNDFNSKFFRILLLDFYNKIICNKYGLIDFKDTFRQVLPNDTRHLAFINLKLQGLHPVEVARLGGHKKISTQEHYFNHVTNLVDLEIIAILSCFKNSKFSMYNKEFIDNHVIKTSNSDFKLKLDIGYCIDKNMECRVNKCFNCESWRIEIDELISKKEKILSFMEKQQSEFEIHLNSFKRIYNDIILNVGNEKEDYSDFELNEDSIKLENASNEISKYLLNYLELKFLEKGNDYQ